MQLVKVTSPGLAHNSYFLASGTAAAVIDPRRDAGVYVELARRSNSRITHIFETHRNEDYVIGSLELARRSSAGVHHGAAFPFDYGNPVRNGDRFRVGSLDITVLETPGHTMESICLAVADTAASPDPLMVFTGDTLFAGDVGRTDLLGPEKRKEAAELLFGSLQQKVLVLPDTVLVFPAHGAGSVCGTDISDREYTTIGFEKAHNPLLRLDRKEFVALKAGEHHYVPPYFAMMERLNKVGAPVIHHLPNLEALLPAEVEELGRSGAQVVDIRSPTSFAGGHVPGSLFLWRDGIPSFAGWFLNYRDPIILVDGFNLDPTEVSRHFVRLGYDNLAGYLASGFPAWFKSGQPLGQLESWSVHALQHALEHERLFLLDVRDISNRRRVGHILGSRHIYLGELTGRLQEIPRDHRVAVYCDAGFKAAIACSLLARAGYSRVINILGGMTAWVNAGLPIEKSGNKGK